MVTEDALFGIEIKSDADSYACFSRQIRNYNLYFDYNYVVVGTTHALHIGEHVPVFWGIITVEQDEEESDVLNPGRLKAKSWFSPAATRYDYLKSFG